jgi:TPR repeat protein
MGYLKAVLAALLLTTFPSVYGGDCVKDDDIADCKARVEREEIGHVYSQFNLGFIYYMGRGVPQNYKEAFKWFKLAAETKTLKQGLPSAQINIGMMYAQGQGVLQDLVLAHMYLNIAAASGDKFAIESRGIVENNMTPSQIETAQDFAREWMRRR